ncbi:MAG TPA: DUF2267 domain-containing protein [Polyangiaceae bacterium]|nr:DUF2267 domain-containing protein [Polyangiaceae bacterium]
MALEPQSHYALASAPLLVNQVLALPLQAQLGLLRTLAPRVLAQLGPEQRDGFERDLHAELSHALRGEESYDVRASHAGEADELYRTPRFTAAEPRETRERRGVEVPVEFRNPDRPRDQGAAAPEAFVPPQGEALAGTPRWPKGYTRSDERMREEACEALGQLPDVDISEVEVWVTEGELTLTGTVPQRSMKYAIELSCARVAGVDEIHNRLRVPRPTPTSSQHSQRHAARATGTYARFMRDVLRHLAVSIEQGEQIVLAVIAALEQRIIPHQAMDLEAQLPSLLQDLLQVYGEPASFRARDIDRAQFIAAIADRLEVSPAQAEEWTRGVFCALNERVSAGEVRQVKNMLPPDIRALWP